MVLGQIYSMLQFYVVDTKEHKSSASKGARAWF